MLLLLVNYWFIIGLLLVYYWVIIGLLLGYYWVIILYDLYLLENNC